MQKMKKNRSKRGFTLVEMVIAMSVITIVSGAAIMVVSSSLRARKSAERDFTARTLAVNTVECIRAAGDDEDLIEALDALGLDKTETDFIFTYGDYVVTIDVTTVSVSFEDKEIYVLEYKRGST